MKKIIAATIILIASSVLAEMPHPTITPLENYFEVGKEVKIDANIVIAEGTTLTKFNPQHGIKCELSHANGKKRVIRTGERLHLDSVNKFELFYTDSSYYTATVIMINEIRINLSGNDEDFSLNCLRLIGHKDNSRVSDHGLYDGETVVVSNLSSNTIPTAKEISRALEYIITMPSF